LSTDRQKKFRVAFFVDDFPSYTQTFVLRQIAGVMEEDWPIDIYARRNSGLNDTHQLIDKHRMIDNTIYLPMVPKSRFQRVKHVLGKCASLNRPDFITVLLRSLNFLEFGREGFSLKLACLALPFSTQTNYDILHSQFGWLGAAACKLRQIGAISGKVVTSFRGYDTEQYLKKNPGAYRHLFKHGDLFLPVCDYFQRWLIDNGCPENKIQVLHSGIDLSEFRFDPRKPELGKPIRLLSVARMVEKKGLAYALEAVARLSRSGKSVHYTILGDGPMRSHLERIAESLGISEHISMPGMKPHEHVLLEIQRNHIMVAPSITTADGDHEGIPNVLKEAMATGMPVVSTWHSGIPELVHDQQTGFLVREKDVDQLTDKLRILIENPDMWIRMGEAGRDIVEKQYDINILNARMIEFYRRLVNGESVKG